MRDFMNIETGIGGWRRKSKAILGVIRAKKINILIRTISLQKSRFGGRVYNVMSNDLMLIFLIAISLFVMQAVGGVFQIKNYKSVIRRVP